MVKKRLKNKAFKKMLDKYNNYSIQLKTGNLNDEEGLEYISLNWALRKNYKPYNPFQKKFKIGDLVKFKGKRMEIVGHCKVCGVGWLFEVLPPRLVGKHTESVYAKIEYAPQKELKMAHGRVNHLAIIDVTNT